MEFKANDKIRCIDVNGLPELELDKIYVVEDSFDIRGAQFVFLQEKGNRSYQAKRFELVNDSDVSPLRKYLSGPLELEFPKNGIASGNLTADNTVLLEQNNTSKYNTADLPLNTVYKWTEKDLGDEAYVPQSASKNDQDKVDLSLIPYIALKAEAKAFMVGEKKYKRYNYTKGHKASQLVAAAMRHLVAWNEGEENDPTDGQPHLGSVRACCAMILRQAELGTLKDDRFDPEDLK